MDIEVKGEVIHLQVKSLGEQIDAYLKNLFTKFVSTINQPYHEFKKDFYPELLANIHTYLDR